MSEGEAGSRSRLGRVRRRIELWRERYGGRGQPIPKELWDAAVEVARSEGVKATARGLRVDRGRLSRRVGLAIRAPGSPPEETAGVRGGFVEVDARGVCAPGQTVLRFEGRDGERLEVELGVTSALDIADLARAFWSRWP
jgi:hypothetical protein